MSKLGAGMMIGILFAMKNPLGLLTFGSGFFLSYTEQNLKRKKIMKINIILEDIINDY